MRIRHLNRLFLFALGLCTAMTELAPVVEQAFSPTIELGELQPGIRIYWKAKNVNEENDKY